MQMSFHSNDSIDSYIHKMDKLLNKEINKEWRVIESVCVDEGEYLLILESNMQKSWRGYYQLTHLIPWIFYHQHRGNYILLTTLASRCSDLLVQ